MVIAHSSESTISNIFNLLFETAVVIVPLYQTLGVLQLQRGLKAIKKKTLVSLLVNQGEQLSLAYSF